jgi:hypothetical protein
VEKWKVESGDRLWFLRENFFFSLDGDGFAVGVLILVSIFEG